MENKTDWERKDYCNQYSVYDEYFLSFHLDRAGIDEPEWKEFVEKWKLGTMSKMLLKPAVRSVSAYPGKNKK